MHVIHRPKFIIKIGEYFFLEKPIYKLSAKFWNVKEKSMKYAFFPTIKYKNLKFSVKSAGMQHSLKGYNSSILRVDIFGLMKIK
jgi:hypothetical protein